MAGMETFAVFVKIAEDARRQRLLKIDLGEDSARLKVAGLAADGHGGKTGCPGWGQAL